jgi:pSer/pThr/pTyr-binding forkhead associated (FHA) protein
VDQEDCMTKLIISQEDGKQREIELRKKRLTIGRAAHNDVVINHPAVSSEHAVIVALQNESFLEDLGSTNGTKVNGQPVKKHFLQDGDIVQVGGFQIKFCTPTFARNEIGVKRPAFLEPERASGDEKNAISDLSSANSTACIRFLSGSFAGKQILLTKSLTTIGKPTEAVAGILHTAHAYYLTHVEGETYPRVNGQSANAGLQCLQHGDLIELAETKIEFLIIEG